MEEDRKVTKEIINHSLDLQIKNNELMKYHTSWKIGGPADFFCIPTTLEHLKNILIFSQNYDLPINIIGNGSNIWVPDDGIRGLVVKIAGTLDKIEYSGKMIKAGSGTSLPYLVKQSVEKELSGLEFAVSIPGTVGGAVISNAGFGIESIANLVSKIEILDYQGYVKIVDETQLNFDYRRCNLSSQDGIVLSAYLKLKKASKGSIIAKIRKYNKKRRKTQPTGYLTAGCVFKNPENYSAGYLIEKIGAKGLTVGNAQVSTKHANFIINKGGASSDDIMLLMEEIEKRVQKAFGISLEKEVQILKA